MGARLAVMSLLFSWNGDPKSPALFVQSGKWAPGPHIPVHPHRGLGLPAGKQSTLQRGWRGRRTPAAEPASPRRSQKAIHNSLPNGAAGARGALRAWRSALRASHVCRLASSGMRGASLRVHPGRPEGPHAAARPPGRAPGSDPIRLLGGRTTEAWRVGEDQGMGDTPPRPPGLESGTPSPQRGTSPSCALLPILRPPAPVALSRVGQDRQGTDHRVPAEGCVAVLKERQGGALGVMATSRRCLG